MRHVPYCLHANTTAAACPAVEYWTAAVEQVDELRAHLGKITIRQQLHWAGSGHGRVARLTLELHYAVRRHARRSPCQHVGVLMLKRSKRNITGALEVQLRVREAERGEMQLRVRAVLKQLQAVSEALDVTVVRLWRAARTAQGAVCPYLCRLEGRQRRIVAMDRP